MLRNGLTHGRASRWCCCSASLVGVSILLLCLVVGALSSLAHAANQKGMLPAERRPMADDSDQAYLLRIYYLVKHDRNAEAYQLGIAAVKVYLHSPSLRLATAVAAVNVQRCGLARPQSRQDCQADNRSRGDQPT